MAPEIIDQDRPSYGPPLDVYSFSMVLYQVLFEVLPFALDHCNRFLLAYEIMKGKRPLVPFVVATEGTALNSIDNTDHVLFDETKLWEWCSDPMHGAVDSCHTVKSLVKIMIACWHQDPTRRPTFDHILLMLSELGQQ